MRGDRSVLHMATSVCHQYLQDFKAAAYAEQLKRPIQVYRHDLKRATLSMKKMATQIDRALAIDSQETTLDDPEKFQAFIWSFVEEIRAGIYGRH